MKVKISLVVVFVTLMAATYAFGDGFNLTSWPLLVADTAIQPVFADSMGTGCQLAGGNPASNSDQVKYFDTFTSTWYSAWYKIGGAGASYVWKGTLTTITPDKGYWIQIKGTHPAVTLTMTGSVNTAARSIPVKAGPAVTFVGSLFAVNRPLGVAQFEDFCNLVGSGFDGGTSTTSDKVRYFDGSSWYAAWYKTSGAGTNNIWRGTLGPGQTVNQPVINPGNGYIIDVLTGHSFNANTWSYSAPAKGAGVELSSKIRTVKREISSKVSRSQSPSTDQSLAREKTVEQKTTR